MTLPYTLDKTRAPQIGLIVLQADETLERDMRRMMPQDVEILVSRVPSAATVSSENLAAMEMHLKASASLFPQAAPLSAVGFGCTSGTAEIGANRVSELVKSGVAVKAVTEPVSSLVAACRHMGVTRLAMISPYVAEVSQKLRQVLEAEGISVPVFDSFDEDIEENVVRISPESIAKAAKPLGKNEACEAVFLSCTNLRTLDVIEDIETALDKPVLSSNQVLAWHLMRLASVTPSSNCPGRLFSA